MDLDIDDILAELDRDTTVVERSDIPQSLHGETNNSTVINSSLPDGKVGKAGTAYQDIMTEVSSEKDFQQFMTIWKNERCSPEILPYPHILMRRMIRRIQNQMEHLEIISMKFFENHTYENTSTSGNGNSNAPANNNNMLPLLCMEAELERVKFVIRSYLRCRLSKVDKYGLYLRQIRDKSEENELEGNDSRFMSLEDLLSKEELEYHQRHFAILLKLLNNSILKHMPSELQAINDTEGSVNMIDEPEWDKFVFVHVTGPQDGDLKSDFMLKTTETGDMCYVVTIPELNEDIELTIGSIYVMRYNVIKELLHENKIALI